MKYIARIKGDFNELRNIAVKGLRRAEDIGFAKNRLYGREFGLVMTAGSDNHCGANWPLYGVELEKRLTSIADYVKIIMNIYPVHLHIPEGRLMFAEPPVIDERHRALMLDENEREHPAEKEWID